MREPSSLRLTLPLGRGDGRIHSPGDPLIPDVRVLHPVRGGPVIVIDDRPRSVGVWELRIEEVDFDGNNVEILARGMFGRVERLSGYEGLAEMFGGAAARSVTELLGGTVWPAEPGDG